MRPATDCRSLKDRVFRIEKASNMSMYWRSLRSSSVRVPSNESHQRPTKSWTCEAFLSLMTLKTTPTTSSAQHWNLTTRRVTSFAKGPVPQRSSTYTFIGRVRVCAARAMFKTTSTKKILKTPGMPRVPKSPVTWAYRCNEFLSPSPG